ncbi:M1 family metallopeptidase [Pelagicoccus sp. SDUM812003]|uniref:M1 family metallopeptidase n=1 Tax=Pelagicoccus sp. SDUM812003 TaxID=3041267 RepID=UPI00280F2BFB|nr:M1 family metallopeptidase [Pelagicoccus sp. SDUM812003]MDQ8201628.1 M1 family metallopeptidase [Pelagicoccus sp. SDUM812003]
MILKRCYLVLLFGGFASLSFADGAFGQLGNRWPSPSEARLASGAPGPAYWQQEANYRIEVELDERRSMIIGKESIEYVNHSPHDLSYLWLQLDQNMFSRQSKGVLSDQGPNFEGKPEEPREVLDRDFREFLYQRDFEGGHRLGAVTDGGGAPLPFAIVETNMRVDLPEPLSSGESIVLKIDWEYPIVDEAFARRTGRKQLEGGDYVYQIAQWYPRMCAYYDEEGWQVKPYMNKGEFALEFGDFEVSITAPEDFVVAATGELQNEREVLSGQQRSRLEAARESDAPVMIVTLEEAAERLESPAEGKRTWRFKAEKVRDFAFAASRGYAWDAMAVEIDGKSVMAMSAYPREAAPLWSRYSTEAIALTLDVYSDVVYNYPYPVAWSTWGPVYGMEYPMISFQSSWDIDEEETYPERVRNYVISVIVHEVGHNWFPMIINSDERQWMWQDEGLNSFVEDIATTRFDPRLREAYRRSVKSTIDRMDGSKDPAIMVAADNLTWPGYQAYSKPALGLTLLRESILGEELFDFAFQEYARRWAFKRPTPADFFRTMEDASGTNLDWFWRAWFYGTDHVDLSLESVELFRLDDGDPSVSKAWDKQERYENPDTPMIARLEGETYYAARKEELQDWYYGYDEFEVLEKDVEDYQSSLEDLEDWQRDLLQFDGRIYVATVKNVGGIPMPMVLDVTFEDGSERRLEIPVDIWRPGKSSVRVPIIAEMPVVSVELDRANAFADSDLENNVFPRPIREGRFKLKQDEKEDNPMREALFPDKDEEKAEEPAER